MPKMNLRGRVCMRERASYRKENIKNVCFSAGNEKNGFKKGLFLVSNAVNVNSKDILAVLRRASRDSGSGAPNGDQNAILVSRLRAKRQRSTSGRPPGVAPTVQYRERKRFKS